MCTSIIPFPFQPSMPPGQVWIKFWSCKSLWQNTQSLRRNIRPGTTTLAACASFPIRLNSLSVCTTAFLNQLFDLFNLLAGQSELQVSDEFHQFSQPSLGSQGVHTCLRSTPMWNTWAIPAGYWSSIWVHGYVVPTSSYVLLVRTLWYPPAPEAGSMILVPGWTCA